MQSLPTSWPGEGFRQFLPMRLSKGFAMTTARSAIKSFAAVLLSTSFLVTPALAQSAPEKAADTGEIVVTAQKRTESVQDVPISIQVLNTEKLDELQVRNFADYMQFLPSANFTTGSVGAPGNASVVFRGVATDGGLIVSGSLPTVGTYLDEQPITSIQGTVDLQVYDVARIESLAGPQGTLFGASSLAGTIRIITNKPDPSNFSASYDLELSHVLGDGLGGQVKGYVNYPLVQDSVALRVAGWYNRTPGYIDNVLRSRTFRSSGITQTNTALVEEDFNTSDVYGLRAQLGIDLDENWTVTPSLTFQETKWNGNFRSNDDKVGELNVSSFYPEFGKDSFAQAGATITGEVADLEVTYAGYYMTRTRTDQNDYSDYGYFYDLVAGSGAGVVNNAGRLIDPSQIARNRSKLEKVSQELRIATPGDRPVRAVAGLFYQHQFQNETNEYITPGFADRLSVPGRPGTVWLTLQNRRDRDYAAFGQIDVDITDKLTMTGGLRGYKFNNDLIGFFGVNTTYFGTGVRQCLGRAAGGGPFGVGEAVVPGSPCTNLGVLNPDGSISPKRSKGGGVTWRTNATYKFTDDNLLWFTASTGFRPGGINRAGNADPFGADTLYNYEIGSKNSLADGRVTLNFVGFLQDWKNVQVAYQPPGGAGVVLVGNVGSARTKGLEADIGWRSGDGFSINAAGTYVDAKLREPFVLFGVTTAPAGQKLPLTPKFKGNIVSRYEWPMAGGTAHVQAAGVYVGKRTPVITTADIAKTGILPSYFMLDLATGLQKGSMKFEIFMRNVTDSRAQFNRAARCNINYCGPTTRDPTGEIYRLYAQPRTIGIRFGQNF